MPQRVLKQPGDEMDVLAAGSLGVVRPVGVGPAVDDHDGLGQFDHVRVARCRCHRHLNAHWPALAWPRVAKGLETPQGGERAAHLQVGRLAQLATDPIGDGRPRRAGDRE